MGRCPGISAAPSSARLLHARWSSGWGRPGTEAQSRLPSLFPAGLSFTSQPGAGFSDPLPGHGPASCFPQKQPPHSPLTYRASQVILLGRKGSAAAGTEPGKVPGGRWIHN